MTADLFGEAEPVRNEPRVLSVSELTRTVRSTLEQGIGVVWVEGEISNYRRQPSGHQYFTLKDAQSQVSCVWFARPGLRLKQVGLADGMQVQLRGALTVYEARGQYQLNIQLVQAGGAGLLQAKFEALKRKLEAEGLFDAERKRPLPKFPAVIGIVTSPTGAALRDILNILARRAPWVRVVVYPVRVQGAGAAEEVAAAVTEFNRLAQVGAVPVEIILVSRGGGSIEDLWAFNEEVVARAVAVSALPVVSAVGHEIDFTIADFVADLRAPTPSAAAELLVPDGATLLQRLARIQGQLHRTVDAVLSGQRQRLDFLTRHALFREPGKRTREAAQRIDLAAEALRRSLHRQVDQAGQQLGRLAALVRQHRPDQLLALRRTQFEGLRGQLAQRLRQRLSERRAHFERLRLGVNLLSPEAMLARGYSVTMTASGKIIGSVHEVAPGTTIVTRLRDGSVQSVVE